MLIVINIDRQVLSAIMRVAQTPETGKALMSDLMRFFAGDKSDVFPELTYHSLTELVKGFDVFDDALLHAYYDIINLTPGEEFEIVSIVPLLVVRGIN